MNIKQCVCDSFPPSPYTTPIKTLSKEDRLNACASAKHMNTNKVGQESTIGTFLQHNLFGLRQVLCICVCEREGEWVAVVVVKSPSTATVKINGGSLDVRANDSG